MKSFCRAGVAGKTRAQSNTTLGVEPSNQTWSEIADSDRPKKPHHPSKSLFDQRQVNQLISVKLCLALSFLVTLTHFKLLKL